MLTDEQVKLKETLVNPLTGYLRKVWVRCPEYGCILAAHSGDHIYAPGSFRNRPGFYPAGRAILEKR